MSADGNFICLVTKSEAVTYWIWLSKYETLTVSWNGQQYNYDGVPFSKVHAMMSADSLGVFLNKEIKPNHECWRY